jgi:iron complex outermembrane receptor protein
VSSPITDRTSACRPHLAAALVAFLLTLQAAAADEAVTTAGTAPASQESVGTLTEVVVTAEKRSSNIETTPISMSALTSRDLQNAGITSAQGIGAAVPGLAVASAGPGQAQYEIRGISASGGESPTVGFYLDETPVTPPASATTGKNAIDPDLYDLERVEVLRGPQGTLFGAGSLGGTVRLIPNSPDLSGFYGSARTMASSTPDGALGYGQNAMVNLPLTSDVALRIVGTFSHTAGWMDRIVVPDFPLESNPSATDYGTQRGPVTGVPGSIVHKDVNAENLTGGRASLLIKPNERLSIEPAVFYQKITQSGMNAYDSSPGTLAHYQPFDVAEPFSDQFTLYSLKAQYGLESVNLTSATGYWTRRSTQIQDGAEQVQNALLLPSYSTDGGLGVGPVAAFEVDDTRQFSQELRAASAGDSPLQWLAGIFYSDYHYRLRTGGVIPGLLGLAGSPLETATLFYVDEPLDIRQVAYFGNLSYRFDNRLRLTLGARRFQYHSNITSASSGVAYTGTDAASTASGGASDSGLNPTANIAYTPSSRLMYYLTAAKGFREGAGNFPIPTTGPIGSTCLADLNALGRTSAPTMYGPDSVWSYEIGEKGSFFDRRMILNTDAYYMRWSNVQEPVALACGLAFTDNATQAAIKGTELELRAALPFHLTLTQNIGYAHAIFTRNSLEAGIVSGQSLYNVPRWTVSTLIEYAHPITSRLRFTASANNSYVGPSEDLTDVVNRLPGRDLVGLRVGLAAASWSVSLYADNLFNRLYPLEYLNLMTFTGPPYERIATNSPRVLGVLLNVTF